MNKRSFRRRVSQAAALLVAHALVFTSMPVYASPQTPPPIAMAKQSEPNPAVTSAMPPAPPTVTVNRTVPTVTPPSSRVNFTAAPTAAEFLQARVFAEPFLPVGGDPSATENAALAAAITTYLEGKDPEDLTAFGVFLNDHPTSAWRASVLTNLGAHYKATGYYTKAADTLMEGWLLAKDHPGRAAGATAERALSELLDLHMQFGKVEKIEALVAQSEGRDLHGGVTERILQAKGAINILLHAHHEAIASAAVAVDQLQGYGKKDHRQHVEVSRHKASHEGASLADVGDLAERAGMQLRLARRTNGDFVPGSIVHLKSGHFSALVRQEGDRFLLADPMLNPSGEVWVTRAALFDESSGYALVPATSHAQGWETMARRAVEHIRGKCVAAGPNIGATGSNNNTQGGGGNPPPGGGSGSNPPPGSCCPPMAIYRFHSLLVSLSITDRPVRYSPPRGPSIGFQLTYNQREAFQPSTFTYSNLGPRWNHDWLSYIEDTPANPLAPAKVFLRGGGSEHLMGFAGDRYQPATGTRGVIVRTAATPIRYERRLSDGSVEVFAQADTGVSPRRVFMTEWRDSAGNAAQIAYDTQFRIVAIADAIGQVTTLSYGLGSDPLKITKVTDPFGRAATFEYNAAGGLVKITDVIGITSEFVYGGGDFIRSLTTPYGTTAFSHGTTQSENFYVPNVWLEAVDPLGGKERLERVYNSAAIPSSEPANLVPQAFTDNVNLNYRNSLYWDKRAMALYPGDHTKARIMRWLWEVNSTMTVSDFMHSEKRPLENRVWYGQMGERAPDSAGPDGAPAKIGRVLDDGTSQIYRREYSSTGLTIRETDPAGRETVYIYGTGTTPDPNAAAGSGTDLLQVKRGNDVLSSATYGSHQALTNTDASGQTTTYTYNAAGQPLTVVAPPHGGLTLAQRMTTYTYDGNGILQNVQGPDSALTTTYTYDGHGRVRTATDPEDYTVTYDYDILDRPTRTTYPDGTYEETQYERLDATRRRDRSGRVTHTFYDSLRRVAATRDPAGRTTTQGWCTCGSLENFVDPNGNVTRWEHDLQGRVTKEIRANGSFKTMVYELTTSRLKKTVDAKLQETQYSYASDNAPLSTTYINAEHSTPNVTFNYTDPATSAPDAHGRLRQLVDGTGTTVYAYHPIGQLGAGQIASADGPLASDTVSYGYDELGRIVTRTINGVTSTWNYDPLERLQSQADPTGIYSYTYQGVTGRVESVTYPNGQVSAYSYLGNDGAHRLQEIHHKKPSAATLSKFNYTYDVVGNVETWTQQTDSNPPKVYGFEYDPAAQLISATLAAATPKRYRYAYDRGGNRTAEQIDDVVAAGTYDSMNRLLSQQPGGSLLFRGTVNEPASVTVAGQPATVSGNNNFAKPAQVPAGTSTVEVKATDASSNVRTSVYQISQAGTAKSFAYDSNGNLTGDGTKTYEWDANDRLVAVNQGTLRSEFTYGAGKRVRIVEKNNSVVTADRRFVFEGSTPLEERDASGTTVVKRFFANGFQQGGVSFYWVQDHLGSVRDVTDSAGTLRARYDYDPWGRRTKVSGDVEADFGFTGQFFHAVTGLHIALHRAYDSSLGRWLSPDPSSRTARTRDFNLYAYVTNNPINFGDLLGLEKVAFHVITVIRGNGIGAGVKTWDRVVVDTDSGQYTRSWALGPTMLGGVPVPGRGNLEASVSGGKGCVKVEFTGWAATNTAPLANIDYNFTITYDAKKKTGHLSGEHNSYPSYQVLKDGAEIYGFGQGPSLFQLFDAMGMVKFSKDF